MSKKRGSNWRRWLAAFAGIVVAFKSTVFVLRRTLRIANSEVQARGSDVAFVSHLVARRWSG
jgi:hypothetical protein